MAQEGVAAPRPLLPVILTTIISSSLVTGIATTLINNFYLDSRGQSEAQRQNMAALLKMATADLKDDPVTAATYSGIMAEQLLVPSDFSCRVVGIELFNTQKKGVQAIDLANSVRSSVSETMLNTVFDKWPCDVKSLGATKPADEKPAPAEQPAAEFACPTGQLFTQFGADEQSSFGKALAQKLNPALAAGSQVTAPQVIASYDSKNVVVRYFFKDMDQTAQNWTALLQQALHSSAVSVKYAYIPGYEQAIGDSHDHTFELWWPKSIPTPDPATLAAVHCKSPVTG